MPIWVIVFVNSIVLLPLQDLGSGMAGVRENYGIDIIALYLQLAENPPSQHVRCISGSILIFCRVERGMERCQEALALDKERYCYTLQ